MHEVYLLGMSMRKFFPKNFFAPRGELGREEVQGENGVVANA